MILSVDIGKYSVHLLYGIYKNGVVEVRDALTVKFPGDSLKTQGTRTRELVAGTIQTGLTMSALNASSAVVTIRTDNMIVRKFEVPSGKERQVSAMVKDEMVYFYNAAPTDVVEYRPLGESEGKLTVKAAAMAREVVDYYYGLLGDLKLRPVALDIHMNSISKLMAPHPLINGAKTEGKSVMLLDFGFNSILAYIFPVSGEEISRDIPIGFSEFDNIMNTQVITIGPNSEKPVIGRFAIDPNNEIYAQSAENFRTFFTGISAEITKLLRFYLYQGNHRPIDNIYIYGGGSGITGICEFLTESVGIPTERILSMSNIRMTGKAENVSLRDCINAAGAVIRL